TLSVIRAVRQPAREADQACFELSTQDCLSPKPAQKCLIEWSIQSITTNMSPRIPFAYSLDGLHSQARRGVHGQIERHQVRVAQSFTKQGRIGEIDAVHLVSIGSQPSRRRAKSERLPAEFVSGNEDCFQAFPGLLSLGGSQSGVATIVVSLRS